ncbi:MAG: phage major capsid protein [Firmicutes bacterium]|nr:phage major capsid protein [Bacillota bacterium]MBE3590831.1 phage major capsid protein [Bacillota bacterium]
MDINELRQKRAKLVADARAILDRAEGEHRDLTAEEREQYDRIMADIDRLGDQITREERLRDLERDLRQPAGAPVVGVRDAAQGDQPGARPWETREYAQAFWRAIREGREVLRPEEAELLNHPEARALVIGTNAQGGYLVPNEFERVLVEKLLQQNVMRSLATVITTSSGQTQIPVESDFGTAAWLAESGAYTPADVTFAQVTLSAYKLGTLVLVSEELLNDSAFDLPTYIADVIARRFGVAEETAFVNGSGTGQPTGVLVDAQVGKTGAAGQTTSVTADDILDLFHALKPAYRSRARWLMADSTARAIRGLKDSTGQYLWQPGLQAGQPDILLGRPVVISPAMPAMAASAKSIAFGDFSYYWIADRQGRVLQRLNELYAANGQIGFRAMERVDGKLILAEAVKVYQNSAT